MRNMLKNARSLFSLAILLCVGLLQAVTVQLRHKKSLLHNTKPETKTYLLRSLPENRFIIIPRGQVRRTLWQWTCGQAIPFKPELSQKIWELFGGAVVTQYISEHGAVRFNACEHGKT